ncbi:MAG: uroporphyrinogen decarboxylase [Clostridiales Family XIII bacterium]|nr:uroporphyrinogen decarboxylase [Clostridiales Family XIII bacterium]
MLTPRENLIETIRGGKPERFVNQFEFMQLSFTDPYSYTNPVPYFPGDEDKTDYWGVTWTFPEGNPGMFPVHDAEHIVLKDITRWREFVKAPSLDFPEEMWAEAKAEYDACDRNESFIGPIIFPGIFEQLHSLMGMEGALCAFYENPKEMHELIDYIADWECAYVKLLTDRLQADTVLHHDDWGSQTSTFMSPKMFKEFLLEPYKRMYRSFHESGIELIVHHSDSYAATFVPYMIEMGIDIWQGATKSNDLPALIKQYGGQISFMAGIDSAEVDRFDWSREKIAEAVRWVGENCGKRYIIPCQTTGGPGSNFEGVYDTISEEIEKLSKEMF